ncbi:MAG TPA: hypothetical protein VF669_03060 [Tepidisphaeraceae bacterium]|jgi:4-amino-4-deoxy-L-arabinose transferase-like glycosyltransferase
MLGTLTLEDHPSISGANPKRGRRQTWIVGVMFVLTLATILLCRIFGPSDLYDKDQSKTIGYTADIVCNGRWLLPRDTLNQESTKPPLYNWIGASLVFATKSISEFVFKLPSIFAALVTIALMIWMGRRIAGQLELDALEDRRRSWETGLLAAMFWIASYPAMKHMYLARPDMLLTMFITGAWCFGTIALGGDRKNVLASAAFWVCIAGAALAKGPAALLPLLYIILASKLVFGSFRKVHLLGWWWGIPLTIALICTWIVPAYIYYKRDLLHVLNVELVKRVTQGGPENIAPVPWWHMPLWFYREYAPWSLVALLAIVATRRWLRGPLGPAALWVLLGIAFFCCSAGKRADYLMPVYPPASVLGACWLMTVLRNVSWAAVRVAIIPVTLAGLMACGHIVYSKEARQNHADNMKIFADQVRAKIGHDQRFIFLVSGYHPMLPLMGRHAGNDPSEKQLYKAKWVVCPLKPFWTPALVSQPVADVRGRQPGVLALYPMHQTGGEHGHLRKMLANMRVANAVEKHANAE